MNELTRGDLRGIERQISQLADVQGVVARQVDAVQTQQAETDQRVATLSEAFQQFLRADALAKELNLAETRIVKVRNEIDEHFGHYGDVRRRATGVLQALDAGIVSHDTVQDTTEDVMIATPRYWLAPALVALAAWSRDDRPLAERALGEALRRDVGKTSLFLSLVLRRYRREQAAAGWLQQFFSRQDPTALRREFIVVLDAVASGAYGTAGKSVATSEINRWLEDLERDEGFLPRQVERWRDALIALKPGQVSGKYPHLEKACVQWGQLAEALAAAGMHERLIAHFEAIFEGELRLPAELERAMDDLLDRLVKDFDAEELPLRQKEAELQAIIDHDGDRQASRLTAQQSQAALEEHVDFPTLLTNAAMRPKEAGASRASERLSVALSREWIVRAHDEITARERDSMPESLDLTIDGWSGRVEDGSDAAKLGASLAAHIDRETQQQVDAVKFGGGGLAAAIIGGLITVGGLISLAVAAIVIGIAISAYAVYDYLQLDKRRDAVRASGDVRKKDALQQLNAALAELVDYHTEWETADGRAEDARALLQAISPVDNLTVSKHDAREVL